MSVKLVKLIHYNEDGLITYLASYQDELAILTQIGAFPPAPTPEEISRNLITRCFSELWNQQKLDVLAEIRSDDVVYHDPVAGDIIGIEAGKLNVAQTLSAFPDLKVTLGGIVAEGDMASAWFTLTGTHKGEAFGMPATGANFTITAMTLIKVANSKIVEEWIMWDAAGLLEQIGAMPKTRQDYSWGEMSQITGAPGDPEENKAIAMRFAEEVFNQKNLDVVDELSHPQIISHNPVISPMQDLTILKQSIAAYLSAFPDFHTTNTALIAEGDKVVGRWVTTCTHLGDLFGIPPTGRKAIWSGIVMFRFADGKIVEMWWSYDTFGLLQQLIGQAPSDKETIREFARRVFDDIWNKKNLSAADELMSSEYTEDRPAGFDTAGINAFKQFVASHIAGFPDINFKLHDIIVEGNMSVVRWTVTGTHLGPFMGVPPDGRYGPGTTGITIFRHEGNKPAEGWAEYDVLGLMGWLGLIPNREIQQWGEPSKVTGDPGDPETNKALIKRFIEEFFNQRKLEIFDELVHPQVISHDPVISPTEDFATLREILGFAYPLAFPDIHADINILVAEGDKVVVRWTVTGTHKGEYFGVPPTGKSIKFTGITIYRIADGKIVEIWWAYDALGLLQQIGVIPYGPPKDYTNVFFMTLSPGLNMISLPLEPVKQYTARSFAEEIGATVVIKFDKETKKFIGFTTKSPGDGFAIEGGEGYIVNVPEGGTVVFTGAAWTNLPSVEYAPPFRTDNTWAFVISGPVLEGDETYNGHYTVTVKNLRTGAVATETIDKNGYFTAVWVDMSRKAVVETGDKIKIVVTDSNGKVVSGPFIRNITPDMIKNAVIDVQMKLGDIIPEKSALLQNYPNPFNPETWIPFHLEDASPVSIRIYNASGQLIRTIDLGYRDAGIYVSRSKAAYWDGKNEAGEKVASGIYFYSINAGKFSATRKMVIRK